MAEQVTELQKQLISALLESGITKNAIIETIDSMMLVIKAQENHQPKDITSDYKQEPAAAQDTESLSDSDGSTDDESTKDHYSEDISQSSVSPLLNTDSVGDHLLRMDPWQAARVIKMYMQQHNIPQREVVESTGLNQSHLSQHLNKGTPMKSQKRTILYSWFERKQKEVTLQYSNPGKRFYSDGEEIVCKRSRRNRFKWGPASTNLLYNAYEKHRNPSKEEREALVEQCNKAECDQRGVSYTNVGGLGPNLVTESRVYNWFANRRKEETFRMKLAIEAANYQDQTPISVCQNSSPQVLPKLTAMNNTSLPPTTGHQSMTSPVLTPYSAPTSLTYPSQVVQTMSEVNVTAASSQVLPSVSTLIHSAGIENGEMSPHRSAMSSQNGDESLMLHHNLANGSSPQPFATSHHLPNISMTSSVRPLIPPNASQALQAMACTVRQLTVHEPIPITTIPNITAGPVPYFPSMTAATVPSVTVSHIARSPVATVEHLPTQPSRSRDSERQPDMTSPRVVVQHVNKQQILQDANENCITLQSQEQQPINGEQVIHHVIQAISPDPKDETEKDLDEEKDDGVVEGLSLAVKMEVNGSNDVDDVDSIAETVTVETTSSGENTPVKDRKNEANNINVQPYCKPTKAVIVQMNGNHDDNMVS